MAVAASLNIAFLAITHQPIVLFQLNFLWGSRTACRQGLHDISCKFLKSKMADGRHFENPKIATFQWKIVRFWWNFVHYIRYWIRWQSRDQKLLDGGGRHLENRFFGYNSSTDCLISVKFCMRKQNGMSTTATWQKLQIFKIQDGGRPPFWKSLNHHISVNILLDFDKIWCTTAYIEPDEVFKSATVVLIHLFKLLSVSINNTYVERNLLLLVTSAFDLPLHTIKLCSLLFSLVYSLIRGGLYRKQTCTVTVIHYCTNDRQLLIAHCSSLWSIAGYSSKIAICAYLTWIRCHR